MYYYLVFLVIILILIYLNVKEDYYDTLASQINYSDYSISPKAILSQKKYFAPKPIYDKIKYIDM